MISYASLAPGDRLRVVPVKVSATPDGPVELLPGAPYWAADGSLVTVADVGQDFVRCRAHEPLTDRDEAEFSGKDGARRLEPVPITWRTLRPREYALIAFLAACVAFGIGVRLLGLY